MSSITISNKAQLGQEPSLFKSKWDTTQDGSANDTVVLPLQSVGVYDFQVDWGDGNRDNITVYNQSEVTHQYSNTGIYEIRIKGDVSGLYFGGLGDHEKIIQISSWGPVIIRNNYRVFYDCSHLELTATDAPNLTTVQFNSLEQMFRNCPNLGNEGNLNSWDVSNITNMSAMFLGCTSLNQELSTLDRDWETALLLD